MEIYGYSISSFDLLLLAIAGGLSMALIRTFLLRANSAYIRREEKNSGKIDDLLLPFNDALIEFDRAEHNHIFIINSFFDRQNQAIAIAKTIANKKNKKDIEISWNYFVHYCQNNTKGQQIGQFGVIPFDLEEKEKELCKKLIIRVIKSISKL